MFNYLWLKWRRNRIKQKPNNEEVVDTICESVQNVQRAMSLKMNVTEERQRLLISKMLTVLRMADHFIANIKDPELSEAKSVVREIIREIIDESVLSD